MPESMGGAAVGTLLARLHASAQAATSSAVAGSGLTADQWRMLDHLVRADAASMSALCSAAALSPATASRAADVLTQAALVYRGYDRDDRRRVVLHAAKRGRALHAKLAEKVEAAQRDAASGVVRDITMSDVDCLVDLLGIPPRSLKT